MVDKGSLAISWAVKFYKYLAGRKFKLFVTIKVYLKWYLVEYKDGQHVCQLDYTLMYRVSNSCLQMGKYVRNRNCNYIDKIN